MTSSSSSSSSNTTMLSQRASRLLLFPASKAASVHFRYVLGREVRRSTVCHSLGAAANVIAAAASGGITATATHAAVTNTLAQVAVTAVAIASGACLSTKVDFLWPQPEDQPDALMLEGVDLTGYPIFNDPEVKKAVLFASSAHLGQFRKTGEPYVTHCIHTGKILAALVPSTGKRAVDTVIAGILHDVVDDTIETLSRIEGEFGEDVAHLVAGVSKLSYINQLLRRHRRKSSDGTSLTTEEANNLRIMLLGMVDDPRVVLIKLADRLHNMRTIYALPMLKAQAVAQETLAVWCSLASRLGVWALKAELEDLCFAVLKPEIFKRMRAELASMWSSKDSCKARSMRRSLMKTSFLAPIKDSSVPSDYGWSMPSNGDSDMRDLLQAVLPFDLLQERRKRDYFLNNLEKCLRSSTKPPKIVGDAGIALASLAACEEALERELIISTSYIPGMEVQLSSRLKSLYSIYSKMKRKDVGIRQVYDARALRVIVGDKEGSLHGPAVQGCYSVLNIVHRLWTSIDGEFDDYIVNPKPSGYQSLHTAVLGPDSSPLEVQIRTQRMHDYAESGLAAHWLYKEKKTDETTSNASNAAVTAYNQSNFLEDEGYMQGDIPWKYSSIKVGHPVLRIEGSHLLAAVVVRVDKGGRELLVAVSFGLEASEAVAERRSSFQSNRWEAYARLHKKVSDKWWSAPGHGDWSTNLEKYILCQDGIFHKQDQFERLLPTFIQVIDLNEEEESEYWMVVSAVFEGKENVTVPASSKYAERTISAHVGPSPATDPINNKVNLLRTMLQWEEEVWRGAAFPESKYSQRTPLTQLKKDSDLGEVVIICWPHGKIVRLQSGSTAADAARRMGLEGQLVLVNGHLVCPNTQLKDGDIVEVRS
ncbi:hypothetical protein LUZ63_002612 [Rhynchospora breviuscula]|uniref:GTP diphosphokinase n=1 Tax=Rhynchospora breviuscula TaxID=2022672 RepID=A0A9Q0CZ38_9POAL|nr:hypothetical protein LUZ63_002612 [Rhynchospora breviuscula]